MSAGLQGGQEQGLLPLTRHCSTGGGYSVPLERDTRVLDYHANRLLSELL